MSLAIVRSLGAREVDDVQYTLGRPLPGLKADVAETYDANAVRAGRRVVPFGGPGRLLGLCDFNEVRQVLRGARRVYA
jgi:hypothetical protein